LVRAIRLAPLDVAFGSIHSESINGSDQPASTRLSGAKSVESLAITSNPVLLINRPVVLVRGLLDRQAGDGG